MPSALSRTAARGQEPLDTLRNSYFAREHKPMIDRKDDEEDDLARARWVEQVLARLRGRNGNHA